MKIFVMYDETGKVRGTMASALEETAIRPGPGLRVHVLERAALTPEEQRRHLAELQNHFRVLEGPSGEPILVRRSATVSIRCPRERPRRSRRQTTRVSPGRTYASASCRETRSTSAPPAVSVKTFAHSAFCKASSWR